MSDETNRPGSEEIEGYFDTLIEEFDKNDTSSMDGEQFEMRDMSRFFEDAKTAGSGFESTVDSHRPRLDEEGMIVLFDEENGIDATAARFEEIEGLKEQASQIFAQEPPVYDEPSPFAAEEGSYAPAPAIFETAADDDNTSSFDPIGAIDVTNGEEEFNVFESAPEDDSRDVEESFAADSNIAPDDGRKLVDLEEEPPKKSIAAGLFPQKGDSVFEIVRKIVFLSASAVFVGAGVVLASTLIQSREAVEEQHDLMEMVTTTVATSINEEGEVETIPPTTEEREQHHESLMNSFVEVSDDVKGFIELPGCDIYYPVVQSTDNDYYLTHTYDNKTNKAGAIFMDYRCVITEDYMSPNIVLYGHNQEDGTMFGNLKKYKGNVDFYKENPIVSFNTGYGIGDYVIFAWFVTNVYPKQDLHGEVFHYHDYIDVLDDEVTFNWYIEQVNLRNQIIPPVDVAFGDQLLVLSTCSTEYVDSRFVVMARKLRPGESKETIDVSGVKLNDAAKGIDWDAVLYGRTAATTTEPTETTTEETTTTTVTTTETTTTTVTTTEETTTTTVTTTETTTEPTTTTTVTTTVTEEETTEPTTTTAPYITSQGGDGARVAIVTGATGTGGSSGGGESGGGESGGGESGGPSGGGESGGGESGGDAPSGGGDAPSGGGESGGGESGGPSGGGDAPSGGGDAPSGGGAPSGGDAPSGGGDAPSGGGDAPSGGGAPSGGDAPSGGGSPAVGP